VITLGSLFSGIGGLELGLSRAGFQVKWQVEYEDYCNKILAKHWPEVKRYGDIYNVRGSELEKVDCICGGFPCQPFSTAGKRKGTADSRWLWPEFYRIICEVRPRWVIIENVPGLLSIDSGRVFAGILRDIATAGYDAEWRIVSAKDVGARHLRKRLFIVANTNGSESRFYGGTIPGTEGDLRRGTEGNILIGCGEVLADTDTGILQQQKDEIRTGWDSPDDGSIFDNRILEALRIRNTGPGGIWHSDPADLENPNGCRNTQPIQIETNLLAKPSGCGGENPADLPDPSLTGCEARECDGLRVGEGKREGLTSRVNSEDISDTDQTGFQNEGAEQSTTGVAGSFGCESEGCGATQSRLGLLADGFSEWLDYTPRVGLKIPDRVNRLKCLGNAVVPEVSEFIGLCIVNSENKGA
jgi:site-specific DNA-cytosine methylase